MTPTLILSGHLAGLHTWHRAADPWRWPTWRWSIVWWRLPTDPSATTVGPTPTVVEVPS
ncbi:MAG: hypothetical protein R2704_16160 [Microthrixaceae bacterium]